MLFRESWWGKPCHSKALSEACGWAKMSPQKSCQKHTMGWAHRYRVSYWRKGVEVRWYWGTELAKKAEKISRVYFSRVQLAWDSQCDWKLLESCQKTVIWWIAIGCYVENRLRGRVGNLEMHRLAGDDWSLQLWLVTKVYLIIGSGNKRAGYSLLRYQSMVAGFYKGHCHSYLRCLEVWNSTHPGHCLSNIGKRTKTLQEIQYFSDFQLQRKKNRISTNNMKLTTQVHPSSWEIYGQIGPISQLWPH